MWGIRWKKIVLFLSALAAGAMLTACGQRAGTENGEGGILEDMLEEDADGEADNSAGAAADAEGFPNPGGSSAVDLAATGDAGADAAAGEMQEMFGKDCIAAQTFSVSLSEYSGEVWFVPFAPSAENPEFRMQIIQDGEVLQEIAGYVPDGLAGKAFDSLDAVSFYDVNFDGCTDIVLIETYGGTAFAAVYYGFAGDADDYERFFIAQEALSCAVTAQAEELSISGIRDFLTGGKKNGEFTDYREAYRAVGRLCALEGMSGFDLIYFDADEIPELVAGEPGYFVSLYTYEAGTVYPLMDRWAYGAMGNAGYEYCARKNSLRNVNSDFAGAIVYTTYMTAGSRHTLDTVVQIETYNFDDVNENGVPDPEEEGSIGCYGISYIDGRTVSDTECASYAAGEYTYMEGSMSLEELQAQLAR